MRNLQIQTLIAALIFSCGVAQAEDLNQGIQLSTLIHTPRAKRSKKYFWLVPGKITSWHYQYVMPDGTTRIKIEDHKIEGVYDGRDLRESHPNAAIIMPTLTSVGSMASPLISRAF